MHARQHNNMPKCPSLFAVKSAEAGVVPEEPATAPVLPPASAPKPATIRPPSRARKRVLSIYLDPIAWKQIRQLALDTETSTQALGEEAINLLFAKHGLNRSA
jgi:hypothetical protein